MGVDGVFVCWPRQVVCDSGIIAVHEDSCIWALERKQIPWPEDAGLLHISTIICHPTALLT